ncbi:adenylate/guanylate cyclase domain-containing protein [Gaiella sp.]|uniref:adenylate/guanylate cyclase domain-containing protein n=1 Tax=Gaiella sp. TaxID=2663207 RepID=UPI002E32A597|nr:adenylate/guanylate cyclase domain-containing protein [Gaiella sp.]HEX5583110.1 adenylate/guanylate cyclase domain-containing protein [Gaiella sp.]
MQPDIRYARNGDVAIAYQVVGEAERDLILVPDYISNLVYYWESPYWRDFYERLTRSFRLILFDKRGTGLSDRGGAGWAALETRMEDMRTVLDAVGSERPVVFGAQEGGQMAALYAATYPEKTEALVLFQFAAYDTHGGSESPYWQRAREELHEWGTQEFTDSLIAETSPTLLRSEADRVWLANALRVGASPEIGLALNMAFADSDLREVLPSIRVPTLLLSRGALARSGSEDAVARIEGARLVQLVGSDYAELFLSPEIVDEVEAFVATLGAAVEPESVLATILFTDLVGSTAKAAELGDRRWRELLAQHHALVRRELARYRGNELDTAGDGFFARFDGPARAIRCACAIRDAIGELGLEVRAGVHTGECELLDGKVAGIAVSIGARVSAQAGPGDVLVSQTVRDLVAGSGLAFDDRGAAELKGVPGEWRLYAVAGA